MCGIAGLINFNNAQEKLPLMLTAIAHRGPDAEGVYFAPNQAIALGHRRLSIIDLSHAADQPFKKDGWILSFNGEIYNYLTLRKELELSGSHFSTHSDTEVLLEAWRQWGPACLKQLRGMFAFALYHESTGELFLARDHFGIKPLFIYQHPHQLAFASELKALLPIVESKSTNYTALIASLLYVWIPDAHCIFKNISKFPAGHWAKVTNKGGIELHRYYHLDEDVVENPNPISVATLENGLVDSVEKHLIADVSVSMFLSGGLDSSLLTAMAKQKNPSIDAYTIAFRQQDQRFEAMPPDADYAKQVADYLGVPLHRIEITPNIIEQLPETVAMLDEPIGDAAAINTFLICQAAREAGVKVLLSGMGADELFAGYRKHYACLLAARYRRTVPGFIRQQMIHPMIQSLPVAGKHKGYRLTRWAQRFDHLANLPEAACFQRSYTYYHGNELKQLLHPDLHTHVDTLLAEHDAIYQQGPDDIINRMCYTDMQFFMVGLNLTYTDRASMAASTEVRVPFIDKEVVKLAMAMPGSQKLHGKIGKYLLKEVAKKWLPKNIITRPKAGFGAPLRSWIRHDLAAQIDEYVLSNNGLAGRGLLNPQLLKHMVKCDRAGKADYSQQIWQWLTLETWLKQHNM